MSRQVVSATMLLMLLFSMFMFACAKVSAADYPAIYVDPASIIDSSLTPGENFTISIMTDYIGSDITAYQFELSYNASITHGVEVTNGDLITTEVDPMVQFIPGGFDNIQGKLSLTAAFFFFIFPPPATTSGPGTLANVTFTVIGTGDSAITLGLGTQLKGWDSAEGKPYDIINAHIMPTHIQHGYFSNAHIYIRSDGSIDPPTAPISTADNITYTLTDNINGSIVVERDHIVVDGAGYILLGTGAYESKGIYLSGRSNVTIENMEAKAFCYGIYLMHSSNSIISGSNITANGGAGIQLHQSSNNIISGNNIANNGGGIRLQEVSRYNTISRNHIIGKYNGISLTYRTGDNTISGNTIANNLRGIWLDSSSSNGLHHNNFINNTRQVRSAGSYNNVWDDGYPSGGNYWSDYEEKYPDAEEIDDSGIWDTPYIIDEYNQDNYPLMEPWAPTPPIPTTINELKTEIQELGSEGEIDNQGIVTSLLAKLNVAQKLIDDGKIDQARNLLHAFISEVQAQSGKHIAPEAAELLIQSAEHILMNL